ncbi:DUF1622 domain-containing protein [Brevundimonas sp.]|uniref:DUF1622 domain-containing protein n=1 Tax=Brevundimonas sp. TaxID=1871086 RepID=UPI0025C2094E|nr:DUF1622 domain-containing protein [Brevundimonas sp.]
MDITSPIERGGALLQFAHHVAVAIEMLGVVIILVAVLLAAVIYFRTGLRTRAWSDAYDGARANLGRGILLGLELLVGADIIATVTAPLTFESVGLLAVVVLIRTFLSFALETEIEGRWPWRRDSPERTHPDSRRPSRTR